MKPTLPSSVGSTFSPNNNTIANDLVIENATHFNLYIKRYGGMTQIIPKPKTQLRENDYIRIRGSFTTYVGKNIYLDAEEASTPIDLYIITALLEKTEEVERKSPGLKNEIQVNITFDLSISAKNWDEVKDNNGTVASHILGLSIRLRENEDEELLKQPSIGTISHQFSSLSAVAPNTPIPGILSHQIRIIDNCNEYSTLFINIAGECNPIIPTKDGTLENGIYIYRHDSTGGIFTERISGDITDPDIMKKLTYHGIFLTKGEAIANIGGKLLQDCQSSRDKALKDMETAIKEKEELSNKLHDLQNKFDHQKLSHDLIIKGIKAKDSSATKEMSKTIISNLAGPVLLVLGRWLSNFILPKLALLF